MVAKFIHIIQGRDASAYFLGSQSRGLYEMDIFLEGGREDRSHVTYDCLIYRTSYDVK